MVFKPQTILVQVKIQKYIQKTLFIPDVKFTNHTAALRIIKMVNIRLCEVLK